MNCPKCGEKAVVVRPYQTQDNETIRHKKCTVCAHVFYTLEFEVPLTPELQNDIRETITPGARDRQREYQKAYQKEYQKTYREKNRERLNEYMREYRKR